MQCSGQQVQARLPPGQAALQSYVSHLHSGAMFLLHFGPGLGSGSGSGPSGSGKSFLAEIVASAAFDTWVEEPYPAAEYGLAGGSSSEHRGTV